MPGEDGFRVHRNEPALEAEVSSEGDVGWPAAAIMIGFFGLVGWIFWLWLGH
jgi:hypothetical protein